MTETRANSCSARHARTGCQPSGVKRHKRAESLGTIMMERQLQFERSQTTATPSGSELELSLALIEELSSAAAASSESDTLGAKQEEAARATGSPTHSRACHTTARPGKTCARSGARTLTLKLALIALVLATRAAHCHSRAPAASLLEAQSAVVGSLESAPDSDSHSYYAHSVPFYVAAESGAHEHDKQPPAGEWPQLVSVAATTNAADKVRFASRQSPLEAADRQQQGDNNQTSGLAGGGALAARKLNRSGADYDFDGFEAQTGDNDNNNAFSPLDSSSSALMASTPENSGEPLALVVADEGREKWNKSRVASGDHTASTQRTKARQQQLLQRRPPSTDNEMSTIEDEVANRAPAASSTRKPAAKSGPSSKFSTLISEAASGARQPPLASASSSIKLPTGAKGAALNIKLSIHPRAPVHAAKARYVSSLVQPSGATVARLETASRKSADQHLYADGPAASERDNNHTLRIFTDRFKYSKPKKAAKQPAGAPNELVPGDSDMSNPEEEYARSKRLERPSTAKPALRSASLPMPTSNFSSHGSALLVPLERKRAPKVDFHSDSSGRPKMAHLSETILNQTISEFQTNFTARPALEDAQQLESSGGSSKTSPVKSTKRRAAWNSLAMGPPSPIGQPDRMSTRANSTGAPLLLLPLSNYVNPYATGLPQDGFTGAKRFVHSFNRLLVSELDADTSKAHAVQHSSGAGQRPGAESIVRSGFVLPQQHAGFVSQRAWPPAAQIPLQNLRALVPAAVALLGQTQSGAHNKQSAKQMRALEQLRQLLVSQQQAQISPASLAREPTAPLDYATSTASMESSMPAGPQPEQMLASSNQLGVSHLGPSSHSGLDPSAGYMHDYADSRPPPSLVSSVMDTSERAESRDPSSGATGHQAELPAGGTGVGQMDASRPGPMEAHNAAQSSAGPPGASSGEQHRLASQHYPSKGQSYAHPGAHDYYESAYRESQPLMNSSSGPDGSAGGYHGAASSSHEQYAHNSRSSPHDLYLRAEHKTGATSPLDPFEEINTSEYERDLADLDDEFGPFRPPRLAGSGPQSQSQYGRQLMSDSSLVYSPDRYEPRYLPSRLVRPPTSYLGDASASGDFISAAGSMSSIVPRSYHQHHQRAPPPGYLSDSELWTDSNYDFSPLASMLAPAPRQYHSLASGFHWRPRYTASLTHNHGAESAQRPISAYSPTGSASLNSAAYLVPSASDQAAYNLVPSYTSTLPGETLSFTMSPLAAAAAAAATALAHVDKTRNAHNHGWTLTLPRLASALTAAQLSSPTSSTAASNPQTTLIAPGQPATIQYRPSGAAAAAAPTYLFNPVPFYAIASRPPGAPFSTAASATTPSILPYAFHPATTAGVPIIAYRPAFTLGAAGAPATPLVAAPNFAYPFRLPIGGPAAAFGANHLGHHHHHHHAHHHPHQAGKSAGGRLLSAASSSGASSKPFLVDLQFAESKSKSNAPGQSGAHGDSSSSGSSSTKGLVIKSASNLTQMARNLSKKMFGSASQVRPQFVAPPANFELLTGPSTGSSSGAETSRPAAV